MRLALSSRFGARLVAGLRSLHGRHCAGRRSEGRCRGRRIRRFRYVRATSAQESLSLTHSLASMSHHRGSEDGMAELDRRTLLRGIGGLAVIGAGSTFLSACGTSGTQAGRRRVRLEGSVRHREAARRLQLARLHGRRGQGLHDHPRRFREGDRDQGRLHHRRQRQRRVLRQGQEPARLVHHHQARHVRAHRLDGRPHDPGGLDPEARRSRRCPTCTPTSSAACRTSASTRSASTPRRGRAASPASPTTSRRSRRSSPSTSSSRAATSRAASRCCRR